MVVVTYNKNSTSNSIANLSYRKRPAIKTIGNKILFVVKDSWGFLGKALAISKSSLNTRIHAHFILPLKTSTATEIKKSILHMKLFGILNISLNALELPSKVQDFVESVRLKDGEGAVVSAMTFSVLTAEMYESFVDVINASLALSSKPVLTGAISVISTPLAITIAGFSTISKTIQLWNIRKFERELDVLFPEKCSFEAGCGIKFLGETLGRLKQKTKRNMGEKTYKLLEILNQKLEGSQKIDQKEIVKIGQVVKKIRTSIRETKKNVKLSLVALSVMIVAIVMFFTAIPLVIPFALMTVSFVIRLAAWCYQKHVDRKVAS